MKILGIDSSGLVASIAILSEGILIAEYTINYKKTHSQTLLPMLDEVIRMLDIDIKDIDAIAIASGPGSFTGLRIGAATAKGLGLALGIPIISIPTVDGLAYNLYGSSKVICPLMDAKRNQVYTGIYEFVNDEFNIILNQSAIEMDEIIGKINNLGREVVFLGDGVSPNINNINENIKVKHSIAPTHQMYQRAAAVATLAQIYYGKGQVVTARDYEPIYLRISQAERELEEKKNL